MKINIRQYVKLRYLHALKNQPRKRKSNFKETMVSESLKLSFNLLTAK